MFHFLKVFRHPTENTYTIENVIMLMKAKTVTLSNNCYTLELGEENSRTYTESNCLSFNLFPKTAKFLLNNILSGGITLLMLAKYH